MAETWSERERRLKREEEERKRRRERKLRAALKAPARAARRAARKAARKGLRKAKDKASKRVFGPCPTCGRPAGPGHTCSMRFSERNAQRLRDRMDKRQLPEHPDLWRGRRAA